MSNNAQISFILNSTKAKEELFNNGQISAKRKNLVKAWTESASEEEIENLAIECGWSENDIPAEVSTSVSVSADLPEGVVEEIRDIVDAQGNPAQVKVYMLPYKRVKTQTFYPKDAPAFKGQAFHFVFGNQTVRTNSKLFAHLVNTGEVEKGDLFPFRADSIKRTSVPAKGNRQAYSFLEGALLETSCEELENAREELEEKEAFEASMSREAQALLKERSAEAEVQAYLAKFGR
jgi:hypothetical protein